MRREYVLGILSRLNHPNKGETVKSLLDSFFTVGVYTDEQRADAIASELSNYKSESCPLLIEYYQEQPSNEKALHVLCQAAHILLQYLNVTDRPGAFDNGVTVFKDQGYNDYIQRIESLKTIKKIILSNQQWHKTTHTNDPDLINLIDIASDDKMEQGFIERYHHQKEQQSRWDVIIAGIKAKPVETQTSQHLNNPSEDITDFEANEAIKCLSGHYEMRNDDAFYKAGSKECEDAFHIVTTHLAGNVWERHYCHLAQRITKQLQESSDNTQLTQAGLMLSAIMLHGIAKDDAREYSPQPYRRPPPRLTETQGPALGALAAALLAQNTSKVMQQFGQNANGENNQNLAILELISQRFNNTQSALSDLPAAEIKAFHYYYQERKAQTLETRAEPVESTSEQKHLKSEVGKGITISSALAVAAIISGCSMILNSNPALAIAGYVCVAVFATLFLAAATRTAYARTTGQSFFPCQRNTSSGNDLTASLTD